MKKSRILFGILLSISVTSSLFAAHTTVRQRVRESIKIHAAPEIVWEMIKDFDKLATWLPAVEKVNAKGGNQVGAERILTFKTGGTITEKMKVYDAKKKKYKYKIIDISTSGTIFHAGSEIAIPVLPVGNYSAWIAVENEAGSSRVSWKASFYRAYPNNNPPAELTDQVAVEAVSRMLKAGLNNLKVMAEKRNFGH